VLEDGLLPLWQIRPSTNLVVAAMHSQYSNMYASAVSIATGTSSYSLSSKSFSNIGLDLSSPTSISGGTPTGAMLSYFNETFEPSSSISSRNDFGSINIDYNSDWFHHKELSLQKTIGKRSLKATIHTTFDLNISEIQILFPENNSKSLFPGVKISNICSRFRMLHLRDSSAFSQIARISSVIGLVVEGTFVPTDNLYTSLEENMFLKPWTLEISASKMTGMAQIKMQIRAEEDFCLNLSSKSMALLVDTVRNLIAPSKYETLISCETQVLDDAIDGTIATSENVDILFLNKLGQDAKLRLVIIISFVLCIFSCIFYRLCIDFS
jgi:hypothetical protein